MTAAEGKGAEFVLTTTVAAALAARLPGCRAAGRQGRTGQAARRGLSPAFAPPGGSARRSAALAGYLLAAKRAGRAGPNAACPARPVFIPIGRRTQREPATVTARPRGRGAARQAAPYPVLLPACQGRT